jgi:CDP-diacylglycerol--serine O-phosphatidyltransferase
MSSKKGLLGYYNYTVVLTYCGMLTAFAGVAQLLQGQTKLAIVCLMLAGFCDMFDGAIAATRPRMPAEKRFGIQIDSLSDLICFGVLPAMLVYTSAKPSRLTFWICGGYVLCALIRLAYFNVMEEERQRTTDARRSVYQGLPVTSIALVAPAVFALTRSGPVSFGSAGLAMLTVVGAAFLLPFQINKPHRVGKVLMILLGLTEFVLVMALPEVA